MALPPEELDQGLEVLLAGEKCQQDALHFGTPSTSTTRGKSAVQAS